jgi:hypothetical protein
MQAVSAQRARRMTSDDDSDKTSNAANGINH